jgi:hypothetical protein
MLDCIDITNTRFLHSLRDELLFSDIYNTIFKNYLLNKIWSISELVNLFLKHEKNQVTELESSCHYISY